MEPVSSIYFFIMLSACSIAILLYRYAVTMKRFLKSFIKISKKVAIRNFIQDYNLMLEENLVSLQEILTL